MDPLEFLRTYDDGDDDDDEHILFLFVLLMDEYFECNMKPRPCRTSGLQGHAYMLEILSGHPARCFQMFRMEVHVFINLCERLKGLGLKDSRYLTVQEQQIIRPPDFNIVPPEIRNNDKFYPFFKNCVGAIDGTHIHAYVPSSNQIPYRGRKSDTTQNILAVCSFDMRFSYVLAGWEGSVNDSRVLMETIFNDSMQFPTPPEGKYYLVDSRYANMSTFLAPHRGVWYHLQDYRGRRGQVRGPKELFNYRHSSLRNVIERCFRILKKRFPILKLMSSYDVDMQAQIVVACCTIHNFICDEARLDRLFNEYENENVGLEEDESASTSTPHVPADVRVTQDKIRLMNGVHDSITNELWNNFHRG
ncbi:protein ALP1-like [Cornus florida]|uniref:protein ALP1-like n=1 Tax=Cornus florida TaxID=4283 RepID=UPI00289F1F58|nr:protein ALP1-like [Cornus florida]